MADPLDKASVWELFSAVRDARASLGLRAVHLQTLQAMLSFLKPGQGCVVFASNIELCRRAGGIDERTLRRHIQRFQSLDFVSRQDSPNRKRYRISGPGGANLSYGLSLQPLLALRDRLLAMAQQAEDERRQCRFLRSQVLSRLAALEQMQGPTDGTLALRKSLRRKLSSSDYRAMLNALPQDTSTAEDMPETPQSSGSDGQTVRHLSKSEKEDIDLKAETNPDMSLSTVLTVCAEAQNLAPDPMASWQDVAHHANALAPMMGISPQMYHLAREKLGEKAVAVTVLLLLQTSRKIRNLPAYFQSLTVGKKAHSFDPAALLARLAATQPA